MKELLFIVEESQDGGYFAKAAGASIFTQANSLEELKPIISDAVHCHFEENDLPKIIHFKTFR